MVLCAFIHYEALRFLDDVRLPTALAPAKAKVLIAVLGAMDSHACHVMLFAAAYYLLRDGLGYGGFGGVFHDEISSFIYFSMETYTTLGYGDIYPLGKLRIIVGSEALTGLLMIGWTASFTYLEMSRYWKAP
jgi:hypothetical protein